MKTEAGKIPAGLHDRVQDPHDPKICRYRLLGLAISELARKDIGAHELHRLLLREANRSFPVIQMFKNRFPLIEMKWQEDTYAYNLDV